MEIVDFCLRQQLTLPPKHVLWKAFLNITVCEDLGISMYLQTCTYSQDIKCHSAVLYLLGNNKVDNKNLEQKMTVSCVILLCSAQTKMHPSSPLRYHEGECQPHWVHCSAVMNSSLSYSDVRVPAVAEQCWQSLWTIMLVMTWNVCKQTANKVTGVKLYFASLYALCVWPILFYKQWPAPRPVVLNDTCCAAVEPH